MTEGIADSEWPRYDAFHVISNFRRRMAIVFLAAADEALTLRELGDMIAAVDAGTPLDSAPVELSKRIRIALYQSHSMALSESGIVEVDGRRNEIAPTDETAYLAAHVRSILADHDPEVLEEADRVIADAGYIDPGLDHRRLLDRWIPFWGPNDG